MGDFSWMKEAYVELGIAGVIALSLLVLSFAALQAARAYNERSKAETEKARAEIERAKAERAKAEARTVEAQTEHQMVISIQGVLTEVVSVVQQLSREMVTAFGALNDKINEERRQQTAQISQLGEAVGTVGQDTARIADAFEEAQGKIKQMGMDLVTIMNELKDQLALIEQRIAALEAKANGDDIGETLAELRSLSERINAILARCEEKPEVAELKKKATQEQETPVITVTDSQGKVTRHEVDVTETIITPVEVEKEKPDDDNTSATGTT
jgi:hypothetical protein